MAKSSKKRALSEGDTTEKTQIDLVDVHKTKNKKNKVENKGAAQNGQAIKDVPQVGKLEKQGAEGKDKALKKLKNKQASHEGQKSQTPNIARKPKAEPSIEELKEKIKEIESRDSISKTAKRKLTAFKTKLRVAEGTFIPREEYIKKLAGKPKSNKSLEAAKEKKIGSNNVSDKKTKGGKTEVKTTKADKKQGGTQGSLLLVKKSQDDEDDDDDDDDDEEETNQLDTTKEESDDEMESGVEEEEDDDDEDEDDEDDEDEEEDDEDDEDDEEDQAEVESSPKPKLKENAQKGKEITNQEGKKKRFVLFVGNVPYTSTVDDIKKHFLTKVSDVVDVRIPVTDANKPRGIAYVELGNSIDYEKGLSLHHSSINGRRINVQYTGNDKTGVAKNLKMNALRKVGKLGGYQNKNNKKFAAGKRGKQP